MNKFEFTARYEDGSTITVELSADRDLDAVTEAFRRWLIAVGYHPDNVREMFEEIE